MSKLYPLLQISLCTFGYLCATGSRAMPTASYANAQVTTDGTVNTQVNQNGNVAEITGGETRGSNLFHSFQDFSVSTGNEAFFNNAESISNIFSRVTGGNTSNIDGLIRANGTADLFLINPAGILFGENASLSIGGSFYGSTADSILFEDGEFSAVDNLQQPVLTINAPIGLSFRDEPEDIVNRSFFQNGAGEFVGLEVTSGQTLALVGGDINFEAGEATASGGNIYLGGLAKAGIVELNEDGSLSYPRNVTLADITLTNAADVDVTGSGGGNVAVDARNLTLEAGDFGGSRIQGGITNDSTSTETQNRNITINVVESINLTESSIINGVEQEAIAKGGDIDIKTNYLSATDSSRIVTFTRSSGDSGSVIIDAGEKISFAGLTLVGSQVLPGAEGNAGNIEISASSLSILDLSQISGTSFGQGNSGNINITAKDTVNIDGAAESTSGIVSVIAEGAIGDGGEINIQAKSLSVTNGGQLVTATDGTGNAGSINLNISNTVFFDGVGGQDSSGLAFPSAAFGDVGFTAVGNGGDINIETNSLSVTNGGQLIAITNGQGDAGNIIINADEIVSFNGIGSNQLSSAAFTRVDFDGIGNGGDINITTKQLSITDGAQIIANSRGQGNAGNINIGTSETILFDGMGRSISGEVLQEAPSGLFTTVQDTAIGNGGDINIITEAIFITNGATIDAGTFGQGDSGNISVGANSALLDNESSIFAENQSGEGGNINLQIADSITLRDNSLISARAFNDADGGNLTINTDFIVAFPNNGNGSDIIASAERGDGGNITIDAESLFGIAEGAAIAGNNSNDIDASSEFSLDGTVTINTPDINPIQGVTELPTNIVVPEETTQQACQANREIAAKNAFSIEGRGGIIPEPGLPLNSNNIYVNGEDDSTSSIPAPIETAQGKIQPARGIKVTEDGTITLTAYRTNNAGQRIPQAEQYCN